MGKGEVDEKKGDKKDGLRKKGHVAAAAGELGEELSARAGAWKLVRAERESVGKRLFRLGAGMPGPRGKSSVMAPRQTQANFGGPFLEQMDFGFFTEKGLFCRDIANPPCVIALMFMNVLPP